MSRSSETSSLKAPDKNDHGAVDHLSRGFSSLLINLNVFDILFERNDGKLLTYPPCVKGYVLNASAVSESWKFQT